MSDTEEPIIVLAGRYPPSWRTVMPSIPLAGYIGPVDAGRYGNVVAVEHNEDGSKVKLLLSIERFVWVKAPNVRPDLNTADGFGCALRWFWRRRLHVDATYDWVNLVDRHIRGTTTGADRLALAQACAAAAEVSP